MLLLKWTDLHFSGFPKHYKKWNITIFLEKIKIVERMIFTLDRSNSFLLFHMFPSLYAWIQTQGESCLSAGQQKATGSPTLYTHSGMKWNQKRSESKPEKSLRHGFHQSCSFLELKISQTSDIILI